MGAYVYQSVNTNIKKLYAQNRNVKFTGVMKAKEIMFCAVSALAIIFITKWDHRAKHNFFALIIPINLRLRLYENKEFKLASIVSYPVGQAQTGWATVFFLT